MDKSQYLRNNVFYRYDEECFVRNLESSVDKASNGASHHEGFEIYIIVPGHNKCSPFSFFFGPAFLRDFVHGIFSLSDVSFHGLYVKKITETNGPDNSKQHNVN